MMKLKKSILSKWKALEIFVLSLMFVLLPVAQAIPLNDTITDADRATFNQVLMPVMKIYNFIKYVASAIAVIALLFAAVSFMTAGSDPKKKDNAKMTIAGVVIGLLVIWAAPLVVNYMIPTY